MSDHQAALFPEPVAAPAAPPRASSSAKQHSEPFPFAAPSTVADVVHPSWAAALASVEPDLHRLASDLQTEVDAGHQILPQPADILRAFSYPLEEVKVLLIGQDPYPTPGHAVGLSFSVSERTRPLPRSLANIYRELATDTSVAVPAHGDLTGWAEQGVMLLNRVLTVRAGDAASHRRLGWEAVTSAAVQALVARNTPLVAVLWGRDAQQVKPLLGDTPTVESVHPSPLSASRGFFGSRPFSRTNDLLAEQGASGVDWQLR
ncbi:uracil-DNA glycosylase [Arthrobacter sp. 260]|uniref:uracil-DNA glycosylase n=1 Tax=Arthrobacter sp. 260 TaxID=2735314 RepID=UPI0014922262|nr:uracil-DNA glycosylase [Arthrobacter sp. 260]NOJ61047.1 uracil-DNA glycosylase [Arthrobacter sp. 260]